MAPVDQIRSRCLLLAGSQGKKMAPAEAGAIVQPVSRTSRSAKLGVDAGELRVQRAADPVDDGDDHDGNTGGDGAELEGGRARFVFHETRNEGFHGLALLRSIVRERVVQRSWVLTLVNLVFNVLPIPLTTAMMATEMPAAMRPYSMAVAPDSSFTNREARVFMGELSLGP